MNKDLDLNCGNSGTQAAQVLVPVFSWSFTIRHLGREK